MEPFLPNQRKGRLKVLVLSNKVPYPANDGSSIAISSIIDGLLKNDTEVHLLSINTLKHYKPQNKIDQTKPKALQMNWIKANTSINPSTAFANLLSNKPYHVSRFHLTSFREELVKKLKEEDFDIVQVEGLAMMTYVPIIKTHSKAKISFRAHNIEYQIWERHVANESNWLKKAYLKIQVKRLKQFEIQSNQSIDVLVAITTNDLDNFKKLGYQTPAITLPCGVDFKDYPVSNDVPEIDLGILASYDWLPNVQGVEWFLNKVWPLVQAKRPETTLNVGGRDIPRSWIDYTSKGIKLREDIPSMKAFMGELKISLVPLLAGSGMRIKIVEQMALGKCIVSTTIGAEGIDVVNNEEIVLRNSPSEMAEMLVGLLQDQPRIKQIGTKARIKAERVYGNFELGKQLKHFYQTHL